MTKTIAVIGGDERSYYLCAQLMAAGYAVRSYAVPHLCDTCASLHETVLDVCAVALPMPALTPDGNIRTEARELSLEPLLQSLPRGCVLFGGKLSSVQERLSRYPISVRDYLASEPLAAANAAITAEGAIALAMRHMTCTIEDARILVVGFGRIGKQLARKLVSLGARVSVSARKPADFSAAQSLGCQTDETGRYARGLYQYRCIMNTVPAPVFSQEQLDSLQPGCVFVDLASGTGALAGGVTPPDHITYLHALALPGKCAPESAARALRDEILRTLCAKNEERSI